MKIITVVILATLAGCASLPVSLSGLGDGSAPGLATLADANNPVEMAAAPVVTKLALATRNATRALKAGLITKQQAVEFRAREAQLRSELETAVARKDIIEIGRIKAKVDAFGVLK